MSGGGGAAVKVRDPEPAGSAPGASGRAGAGGRGPEGPGWAGSGGHGPDSGGGPGGSGRGPHGVVIMTVRLAVVVVIMVATVIGVIW
ncbi:hypothetical protein Pta02_26190 [Planobispora takensis]|uniref:Uncharacterized protein n=1 Tax=Planobispora takensis TaxID=1367882 RepID=A0A8J3WSQ2_9ACTN|nr:hypothetical protein Pta02_26190 [Planobispora takensis]